MLKAKNLHEKYESIFPGVTRIKKSWRAQIRVNGKFFNLGSFYTELDAYHVYVLKHKELGIKINTKTKAHKKYLKNLDFSSFRGKPPKCE